MPQTARTTGLLCAVTALALTACGDSAEVADPADAEQVAALADSLVKPQPGEYEVASELIEFQLPGIPDDQAEMMRGIMEGGFSQTTTYCLTAEQAEKGWQDAVEGMQQADQDCEYSKFETAGNTLTASMTCTQDDGTVAQVDMTGDLAETSQDITMAMSGKSPEMPGGEMQMKLRMKSTRIGECTA
ncbi:DUF3617 domain-containing protein [Altererythrobacter sp. MTPC7]|uniref:DUF3617 domain-containing protein n=1 Tax=Altererythrobacter sp. MTPC7 TaxID=3056567 RepID=UPI0036F34032